MRITKVVIEGMHNVVLKTYTFNNLTYLHGSNGAGKSTVMEAIQLALLGYIPGTSKASKSAIFEHSNGHALAVTLHLDDNGTPVTISRVWSGVASSVASSISYDVDIEPKIYAKNLPEIIASLELPIFNFNDFMDLTANKMKDWFINFLPSADMLIDWKQVLADDASKVGVTNMSNVDKLVNEVVTYIQNNLKSTGSDLIRDVNTYLKDCLSYSKQELERAQSTIQSLIYHDDIDTSLSIDTVLAEIKSCEAAQLAATDYARAKQKNDRIYMQLRDYDDCNADSYEVDSRYIEATKHYNEASDTICKYQQDIIELQSAMNEIRTELSKLSKDDGEISAIIKTKKEIVDNGGFCPFTKLKCESVQPLIKQYTTEITALEQQLDGVRKNYFDAKAQMEETDAEIHRLNAKIKDLGDAKADYTSTISTIQYRYTTKARLNADIVVVPEVAEADYTDRLAELREIQVKYEANKRYNELIDKLTADKYQIEERILLYKSWINLIGVNGLQNDDTAIKPFIDLQAQMDKYLQAVFGSDIVSKFNLEAKANSFSFGVTRDGKYIPFNLLSSGEKCMYTLALMLSLTEVSPSPLKLVMVDDLLDHLDDVNLDKLFESLSKIDNIQMIFAGVKPVKINNITVEVTK